MAERPSALTLDWSISEYGVGIPNEVIEALEAATRNEQMIPLTKEVITGHQRNVLATHMGKVAGYAALAGEYAFYDTDGQPHRGIELGGAVVMPDFRRQGIARDLLHRRVELLEHDTAYAMGTRAVVFTNTKSRPYIEEAGFRPLVDNESLGKSAFELCKDCTHCPLGAQKPWEDPTLCCDYSGIRVKEIK